MGRRRLIGRSALFAGTLAAANTANAVRPLRWSGRGAVWSFALGLAPSELPLSFASTQAVGTAAAWRFGAGRSTGGRLGLALTGASIAGLVGMHLRARPSERVVEQALRDALGGDYRSRITQPAFPEPGAPLGRRPGWVRMLQVRRRYAHDRDLPYGPAGRRNHLDIWRRDDLPRDGRAPVLIQVHGGAWVYGSKAGQAYPLMSHLAERGWVCVSLNYRLGPRSHWPDQIVDVKRAVAWVRQHIADYGGDPDFLTITGGSAGGHLTALHALTAPDRRWQPGFEDVDTTVAAAVPFYGVYDWTNRDDTGSVDLISFLEKRVVQQRFAEAREVFDEASPRSHVRSDAPPFFVLHGTNDTLVPVGQARAFVAALREASANPVAYAELPGAQHAFDVFGSVRAAACAEAVERFLGVVYGDYRRAGEQAAEPARAS